jgi:hypothetical protein
MNFLWQMFVHRDTGTCMHIPDWTQTSQKSFSFYAECSFMQEEWKLKCEKFINGRKYDEWQAHTNALPDF